MPMRRTQTLDAATFLIDGDQRLAPDRLAQIPGQPAKLLGGFDIAGEEDEAPWIGGAKKRALIGAEARAGNAAKDRGALGRGLGHLARRDRHAIGPARLHRRAKALRIRTVAETGHAQTPEAAAIGLMLLDHRVLAVEKRGEFA